MGQLLSKVRVTDGVVPNHIGKIGAATPANPMFERVEGNRSYIIGQAQNIASRAQMMDVDGAMNFVKAELGKYSDALLRFAIAQGISTLLFKVGLPQIASVIEVAYLTGEFALLKDTVRSWF